MRFKQFSPEEFGYDVLKVPFGIVVYIVERKEWQYMATKNCIENCLISEDLLIEHKDDLKDLVHCAFWYQTKWYKDLMIKQGINYEADRKQNNSKG